MANRKPLQLNQAQVLELLGIGIPRLKRLQGEGLLPGPEPGTGLYDGRKMVSAWTDYRLSEVIGLHDDDEDGPKQQQLNPAAELARLNAAKADAQERQNAIDAGEYVPCSIVEILIEQPVAEMTAALDALPQQIKSDIPHLRATEVRQIEKRTARVRNNIARFEFSITDAVRAAQ